MNFLNAADWFVICLYLAGITTFGVWLGRDQKTTRDYFLGGRNISWWSIGLSIVAAETSAVTIIGVPAMAYGGDLTFLQMIFGYIIARILLAIFLVPYYFKGEIYSPYQLLGDAFGLAAREVSGGFFLVSETLAAGVRVYVACIPIQLMLGWNVLPAIVLFIGLALIYTFIGGVKAVIWTDALQFGLFLAGGIFTILYIPHLLPGTWNQVWREATELGKLHWYNGNFSWGPPINIWMGLIGGTVLVLSTHGAEQLIVQRVLACKNVRAGRQALLLSAVLILPLFLVFLLVGAWLAVYYQHFPMAIPLPESRPGIKSQDFIYPIFMITAAPHWLKGFLIVAILSAAMSSVSSALTSLSSVSTMDFVKNVFCQGKSDYFYLRFSKYSTVFWAILLVLVGYFSRQVPFVLNAAFSLRGLTSGALLSGVIMAVFFKKMKIESVLSGLMSSFACMVVIQTTATKAIYWPWYTLIGCLIAIPIAFVVDFIVMQNYAGSGLPRRKVRDEKKDFTNRR